MLKANIKLFAGIEGSIATEATIGVERNSISREGIVYYNDKLTRIKENSTSVNMIGNIPNVKASVGGFLSVEPGIEVMQVAKLGIEGKSGIYYDMSTTIESTTTTKEEGKLSWKNTLTPTFEYIWPLANLPYFSNQNQKIARLMPSYEYSILVKQWTYFDDEQKPSDLTLSSPLISEVYFNDENLDKTYTYAIENSGEKTLNWEIKREGNLANLLDISLENGVLESGEKEYITVIMNFDINDLAGETISGLLKFRNKDNPDNKIEQSVALIIKPRAVAPNALTNVYLTGESIKYINFDLPSFDWGINDIYEDKGFKILFSDYNESTSSCSDSYQLFHTLSETENYFDISNNWTKVNFDEKQERFSLEAGKRYCFKYAAYLLNESSTTSSPFVFNIPAYGSLVSAIKDNNNNPINATIRLTMASNNTSSDESGSFNFDELMPGKYRITIEADGYNTIIFEEYQINSGVNALEQVLTSSEELQDAIGIYNGKHLANST